MTECLPQLYFYLIIDNLSYRFKGNKLKFSQSKIANMWSCPMKFKVWFIFFLVSTFMMEEIAVANPIFTITGSVTKSDGSLADNGLTVTVSNASRDLTQISTRLNSSH